jgi:tripartite-type tricarboxylate transporter receptor subunit TctC
MKFPHRRQFLHLAVGAAALSSVLRTARTDTYPSRRRVRIVVSFAAGGPDDIIAGLIGRSLSQRLSQQFIVENRPGAGGNIGAELVVRAAPDGYTLLLIQTTNAINETLYDTLNFDFIRDIVPVAGIVRLPLVVVVNPSFPAKTVPEFIRYAKANPGKLNMASAGIGTTGHVAAELFKKMAGIEMLHVPYKGAAPAITDLLGGRAQVFFGYTSGPIEHIRAGTLRALAATTATRTEVLAEVPTAGEFVPGYEASGWQGIGAPRNTPTEVIERLNKEINAALADPQTKVRIADLGVTPLPMTPAAFSRLIADDAQKWGKVIRAADIEAE